MTVALNFSSNSLANGLSATGFERSQTGLGYFFNAKETKNVSNNRVAFGSLAAPGDFAFRVNSATGAIFRSGPLPLQGANTDTFHIVDVGTVNFTGTALKGMLPATPFTAGGVTITSLSLIVGSGKLSAPGIGWYGTFFGPIPISFTYDFTFDATSEPADMRFAGGIPPSVAVRTLGLTAQGASGGLLGWLVNALVSALFGAFRDSIETSVEATIQARVNAAVAAALSAQSAPVGTIATAESLSIDPVNGLSVRAWAGFSLERACGATPTGGSVNVRPQEHLEHMRAIRDRVLKRSPQGMAYAELFETFSPELVKIFIDDAEALALADSVVARVLEDFPSDAPERGEVSAALAEEVLRLMGQLERSASDALALTLRSIREDVGTFVGRRAFDVLAESFELVDYAAEWPGPEEPEPDR